MFGSLANFLHLRFNRQLVLVIFVFMISISNTFLPHYSQIWAAHLAMVFNGIGSGAWDCGSQYWLIEVWPARVAVLLQVNQFIYNFGGNIATLLAAPFKWDEATLDQFGRNLTMLDRRKSLMVPYFINGYIQATSKFNFLFSLKYHSHKFVFFQQQFQSFFLHYFS